MHNNSKSSASKSLALKVTALALVGSISLVGPMLYQQEEERRRAGQKAPDSEQNFGDLTVSSNKPDFAAIEDVNEKKDTFFSYLRPSINIENKRITKERAFLTKLSEAGLNNVDSEDASYAKRLGKLYSLPVPSSGLDDAWLKEMLNRVNVLPEALVLTQAANESAWGTSRFATKANNYFGHWCYTKGCGLVPLQRNEGSSHEVATFSSSQESVHRYFMNLNRNRAYADLRAIRAKLAAQGDDLLTTETATELTNGLLKYSERGSDYVTDLQAMIRHNEVYWKK
ncbi:putative Bax protein [Vibrio chagasii]|uniref:glucosaminidase domain-containing protein n=1 Tax=Vibrio TaxID=662 RepID=UPI000E32865C|nr:MULTISPECIES: glucosaminidase domain-containing protein [Vibrio]MDE9380203.1 glucosaminidase domain-containing protein [Vibrio alginolyticus]MCG9563512.1 glucosaminidase domain-containing protein [Vibrio chagasii]MCG9604515.1 glucosaminidase domain-containing protein [Vibrio chagasii]MCG9672073.1 glucosaminidase domain-containing protein [Vibrio chagasii]NOI84986.1 glucosaminidase [Vibrio sp. 99K-1]